MTSLVSIVTGSLGGVGRCCVKRLLNQGNFVFGIDSQPLGSSSEQEYLLDHPGYVHHTLDIRNEEMVEASVEQIYAEYKRIDRLIHCASILRSSSSLCTLSDSLNDDWRAVIEVNLVGAFYVNKHTSKKMLLSKSGNIVNVASTSALVGRAYDSAYCASKFGLIGMSESLNEEVMPKGVRVQCLLPDAIDTLFWEQNGSSLPKPRYMLSPESVADAIMFLLELPADAYVRNLELYPFKTKVKSSR